MVNWALRASGQRTRWDRRKADPQVGHGGEQPSGIASPSNDGASERA